MKNIIIILIFILIITYNYNKIDNIEDFTSSLSDKDLSLYVYQIYSVNIIAIQNLTNLSQIILNTNVIPGDFNVKGSLILNNNIISFNIPSNYNNNQSSIKHKWKISEDTDKFLNFNKLDLNTIQIIGTSDDNIICNNTTCNNVLKIGQNLININDLNINNTLNINNSMVQINSTQLNNSQLLFSSNLNINTPLIISDNGATKANIQVNDNNISTSDLNLNNTAINSINLGTMTYSDTISGPTIDLSLESDNINISNISINNMNTNTLPNTISFNKIESNTVDGITVNSISGSDSKTHKINNTNIDSINFIDIDVPKLNRINFNVTKIINILDNADKKLVDHIRSKGPLVPQLSYVTYCDGSPLTYRG